MVRQVQIFWWKNENQRVQGEDPQDEGSLHLCALVCCEQLQLAELIWSTDRAGTSTSHSVSGFLLQPVSDALKGGDICW